MIKYIIPLPKARRIGQRHLHPRRAAPLWSQSPWHEENDLAEGVYTTEYRLYDARLGRWSSVDPYAKNYAGLSPYGYCAESLVSLIDPDGRDLKIWL